MAKQKTEKKLTEKELMKKLETCKNECKEWEKSHHKTVKLLQETQNEYAKERNENKELTDTLQRVQADFENYKKRVEKEKNEFCTFANKDLILQILPVLDNFELILKNNKDKIVTMLYAELFSVLEKLGVQGIVAEGKKFDPYLHEALLSEESDKEEGIVLEELQKGYMLNDKILRHSKVKVSKGKKVDKKK